MEAMGMSTAKAVSDGTLILNHKTDSFPKGICTHNLSSEFGNLESAEGVHSAQAATATLHKYYVDAKSAVIPRGGLSGLFSSGQALKAERARAVKTFQEFKKYHTQGEPRKSDRQADLTQTCQI